MHNKHHIFMGMLSILATASTCRRRKVGCILTDANDEVLALGYNGAPTGMQHCIDVPCAGAKINSGSGLDKCIAIHAEQNALMRCHDIKKIHTAYISCTPCMHCMKLLLNTSCQLIVAHEIYDKNACDMWETKRRIFLMHKTQLQVNLI